MTAINKYNTSMIYSIRSPHTDKYYIGSTTQKLCKRFGDHTKNYKAYLNDTYQFITSFKILELGDAYIELLEEMNCDNKTMLQKREGELIREHKNNCVNKCIAGRTKKEYHIENKELEKQYRLDNKEYIQEQQKQYRNDNKEHIRELSKQYRIDNKEHYNQWRIDNKEHIREQAKQYRIDNKEQIKEQKKQYSIDNKEKIKEQQMQYRIDNKEHMNEQRRQRRNNKKKLQEEMNNLNIA